MLVYWNGNLVGNIAFLLALEYNIKNNTRRINLYDK